MNRRHREDEETVVPPVLPHVVITVTDNGSLQVTVNDEPLSPPESVTWTRSDFGRVLGAVPDERKAPVRIEVRESDGAVFTDLLHPRRRRPAPAAQDRTAARSDRGAAPRRRRRRSRGVELAEITGQGFVPGEAVAVAVIIAHTDATTAGEARALLDRDTIRPMVSGNVGEVVLIGRVSGTLCVRGLR